MNTIYYTKIGDNGKTSLYNGEKRSKSDDIFECLNNVDMAQSHIAYLSDMLQREINSSNNKIIFYFTSALILLLTNNILLGFAALSFAIYKSYKIANKSREYISQIVRLSSICHMLYKLSACIATPLATSEEETTNKEVRTHFSKDNVEEIEYMVKDLDKKLPKLTKFILPGGCEFSSQAHIIRNHVRIMERSLVKLNEKEPVRDNILPFANRLSSYFFALSRYMNIIEGCQEMCYTL